MQWLIDLVIEAIGIPPTYIDRGGVVAYDFDEGDLTQDGTWYDLDLSGIVPVGASAVNLHWRGVDAAIGRILYVRPNAAGQVIGTCTLRNQVANISIAMWHVIALPSNRKIQYRSIAPGLTTLNVVVRGWWL